MPCRGRFATHRHRQAPTPHTVKALPGQACRCSQLNVRADAILGALSLPDIGQLFPDTDPKWKGATSDQFVREAVSAAPSFFGQRHGHGPWD